MYCKCFVKLKRFDNKISYFEEHSPSCVVYFRFSGTLFPVSMIDGAPPKKFKRVHLAGTVNR